MRTLIIIFLSFFIIAAINSAANFKLTSSAFTNNGKIPDLYTCNGKNFPPPLQWSNAPTGTKSFVVMFTWPEASLAKTFYGWIVYNIPGDVSSIKGDENNLPPGVTIGNSTYGYPTYEGPCPITEKPHKYTFTIYALDTVLYLPEGANEDDVFDRIKDHVLDQTTLTGVYQRH